MSSSTNTTAIQIWKNLANKEYRDSYVAAHISNTVASQIHMLREQRGWTQKELAQKAGMSQSRISALEDPNYENIEVGTLKRLAAAFDVAVTVRFEPFSELAVWAADLSEEKLLVADFANDHAPNAGAQTIISSYYINTSAIGQGIAASGFYRWPTGYFNSSHGVSSMTVSGTSGSALVSLSSADNSMQSFRSGTQNVSHEVAVNG